MSDVAIETNSPTHNPIDVVEELVMANEWPFDRSSDDEIAVEISGRWCDYRLYFVWQDEVSAMQFSCQLDMKVPPARRPPFCELLAEVNGRMWVGHFDASGEDHTPVFRHAVLLRGARGASTEQVEDLVEIAVAECERYYPAFQFLIWGGKTASEAVAAAILDTAGEA